MRPSPDAPVEAVLVLRTLGAPERRLLRGRRGRTIDAASPEPVPTSRATLVAAEPFGGEEEARDWLASLRREGDRADRELDNAMRRLNRALHAQRAASADPSASDVSAAQALVVRIGYGSGEEAAEGRFAEAWELPRERRRTRRSMEAPEERFAAILSGRELPLAGEELVLRARADLDAGRTREAALEARVALEALLAELPSAEGLADRRGPVGDAANAALRGELGRELADALTDAVEAMEQALKRRRLSG
ncbi:MAG TPA: hypothetical protein VHG69_14445 [Thermoleophilaceae bacterium]|nr:hypothetical protein [Thermoleophilaceae bacterium]